MNYFISLFCVLVQFLCAFVLMFIHICVSNCKLVCLYVINDLRNNFRRKTIIGIEIVFQTHCTSCLYFSELIYLYVSVGLALYVWLCICMCLNSSEKYFNRFLTKFVSKKKFLVVFRYSLNHQTLFKNL